LKAKQVEIEGSLVLKKCVEVVTIRFLERVMTQPPPRAGVVIPIVVVAEIRLIVMKLGRESERVNFGHGA